MTDYAVDRIAVDAESESSEAHGPTKYSGVNFLEVTTNDGERHVWFDGKHYLEVGIADAVNEGDVFYITRPMVKLWKVTNIDEQESPQVTVGVLYPSNNEDHVRIDTLTGEYEPMMGDPGPPLLLEEQSLD